MELNLKDLNADVIGEIESWLDEPSKAVFTFVFYKKAYGIVKEFDALYNYRPQFVQLFFDLVKENLCENAAKAGNLELLKWARESGCYLDEETCAFAASAGHLEVLKWARENGCEWDRNYCLASAEKYEHKHIVDLILKN
jgi:hypothetical protein